MTRPFSMTRCAVLATLTLTATVTAVAQEPELRLRRGVGSDLVVELIADPMAPAPNLFHLYRGDLDRLSEQAHVGDPDGRCDLPTTGAEVALIDELLSPTAHYYLLSSADDLGVESSLGRDSDGMERLNLAPCPPPEPTILEVYYGLDELPPAANLLCAGVVAGQDGVPVTFSVQLDGASVTPEDFAVETATGARVTPDCATLAPAIEPLERRTVLLTGTFGTAGAQLRGVEVVGVLEDLDGNEITGLRSEDVTPLEDGPSLVLAERYLPTNPGINDECPTGTAQVVQLVWGGGVTGPANAPLGEPQRLGVSVRLEDGSSVQPIALADDDPDNYVYACLDAASPAIEISVAAGLFHDPGDDANPTTSALVLDRTP